MSPVEPACKLAGHEYEPAANCRACAADRLADTEADRAPMRPTEPPPAIVEVAERHRARQAPPRPGRREFAQPAELQPPDGFDVARCGLCGGHYVDTDAGRAAHVPVFAHAPEPASTPVG